MPRDYHVFAWEDEPSDERPSEFMRSTGYGGLYTTTQHASLYGSSQYGGFASSTQMGGADSLTDSTFTRPSPLPRERVPPPRRRFVEVPIALVLATIFGGAAYLLYEFARIIQR